MKKKSVINLIKCHIENDKEGFIQEAYNIADDFEKNGDIELAQYIVGTISNNNVFSQQSFMPLSSTFSLMHDNNDNYRLSLPLKIQNDLTGIANVIDRRIEINKFLFVGASGTGKTESVKMLGKLLNRKVFLVNFSNLIDSKLGQTQKNIEQTFNEINKYSEAKNTIFLFDEIDSIALDRINSHDLREMGRVTSTMLKCLDSLNNDAVIIATTNLFNNVDPALIRRFDKVVNFNVYSLDDMVTVGMNAIHYFLNKFHIIEKNDKLARKILEKMKEMSPGELKNHIKTSIAFSDIKQKFDYLNKLFFVICDNPTDDVISLKKMGFTTREIEVLTSISKSKISNLTSFRR